MSPSEKKPSNNRWQDDFRRYLRVILHFAPPLPIAIAVLAGAALGLSLWRVANPSATVVVYAAQDQVYAEPILKAFEKETGLKVRAVYDSEAVKTVGLANRLLAERHRPLCDVFWGNEELRTRQLAAQKVFRETNGWVSFGYRSRRLAIRVGRGATTNAPRTLLELTNRTWRGQVALAYPLFGTTAAHLLALRQHWGESNWLAWCRALAENKPFIVDGNSVAVRLVVRGDAAVGLTDSDDIAAARREGADLEALPITSETLLMPNTVAVVRNSPHPEAAQRLFEHLQRREVAQKLVALGALEGVLSSEVPTPTLQPDWDALLGNLEPALAALKQAFKR